MGFVFCVWAVEGKISVFWAQKLKSVSILNQRSVSQLGFETTQKTKPEKSLLGDSDFANQRTKEVLQLRWRGQRRLFAIHGRD